MAGRRANVEAGSLVLEWARDNNPGIELASLMSPALAGRFLTMNTTTWEAQYDNNHGFFIDDIIRLKSSFLFLVLVVLKGKK